MTTISHINTTTHESLLALLDQFLDGCDPDFDNDLEELERQFAELRSHVRQPMTGGAI